MPIGIKLGTVKKLLRSRDKILITLAFLGDAALFAYVGGHSGYRKGSFFDFLDVKKSAFRSALYKSLRVGEVEKVIENGEPYFRITSRGKGRLVRMFPIYRLAGRPWDGKWRVVIFDIPEVERNKRLALRAELISLGFGKLQKSVYISPLDILADLKEYLGNYELYSKVIVFEAREIFTKDQRIVANYVWQLNKLNQRYLRLIDLIYSKNECDEKEWEQRAKEIKGKFFDVLRDDPILPKELLPSDWAGDSVKKLIAQIG